ncbi:MAG: BamA/TamA family outer membrane protein [Bacteroidales bacterium]|nr:BamA/TamA family outer membrane protein [Bacteroidales bacterium]
MKIIIRLYKSNLQCFGLLIFFFVILFSSCSPVKYVPDDEYLLDRYRIKVIEGKVKKEEIKNFVRQKPNKRILGLRFHLWLYNLSRKDSNKEKGLSNWLRTIGEEPIIYDDFVANKSVGLLKSYFDNKGYYNSKVIDTVLLKRKRARVLYKIEINEPYKINKIKFTCNDTLLAPDFLTDTLKSLIKIGDNFDLDVIQDERQRIETNLKNKGYYSFNKEFIYFQADSSAKTRKVDLILKIQNFQEKDSNKAIISTSHKKAMINKVFVFTNFDQKQALELGDDYYKNLDTSYVKGVYFISKGIDKLNKRVILQSNFLQEGELYSLDKANRTYKNLTMLRLFKIINIQFDIFNSLENDSLNLGYLNCNIKLTKHLLQSYTVELQGTNSYGNIGIGGNFLYRHRSIFGGAEITDFRINGAIEAIDEANVAGNFYTTEFGGNVTVSIPKFILPVFKGEKFSKKYTPKTLISIGYKFQDRIDYRRSLVNMSYGYLWDGNKFLKHSVKLLDLNAVDLPNATQEFKEYIDSTNLRSSYEKNIVSASSYSLIFNNQDIRKVRDFYFCIFSSELSGNLLSVFSDLTNANKNENGSYEIFGIPFSQYAKFDVDFRFYDIVDKSNTVVYRIFGGIGIPYGNSGSLPFEKMYFSGGANGIRAWNVRDLGPGSYSGVSGTRFPNQTGDIKLEANIEYRFKLFWVLEGALFIDAGNVWNIYSDDFEGGLFRFSKFYNEFAIGSGIGTRFDFSFFLFRLDLGIKLRDPAMLEGDRWMSGFNDLTWNDDFTINIGIGYPF